ncbi:type II toxin-antitoxin system prevent-host-death family antitoxin [Pseudomonas sp. CFBP 8770]|uniref:type II toxin-antitoxin system Phd/YefM family antitoxin n=1 Tax=unclassified Pseudomonas TaxID=196821 RepID=UPI00178735A5|nr:MULTISPECIES: type II toxin-antitoxin system prevent-host-death family antitoxin [unclassified Pseudomonas]MBD8473954.1 type II toxin-antitoxin system prevent-host-death family antitoxin [Pseudomonas sp. CFBP 8773]MBD8647083.1 type II toxin-antitoxin system prevent-host-death family antitoxin [Pseudomonas sp. CFBP 8770]
MAIHNVHDAKSNLSRLLDQAAAGEVVVIAKAGKPVARLVAYDTPQAGEAKRIGFMLDLEVPEDFDELDIEVANLFEGKV